MSARKLRVRVTYSTITEESCSDGDHADNGYMMFDGRRAVESATEADFEWKLRDAMQFMSERCDHIETDWTPTIGTGRGFGSRWFSGTGNTSDCEEDEIEVCYDLHVSGMSDGSALRLARVMANNGVYFANVRELQRRRAG